MATKTIKMSELGQLSKLTANECVHQLLLSRNSVGDNARKASQTALSAWFNEAPFVTGASGLRNSLTVDNSYKYSSGLAFDNARHAVQANALNANSYAWRGFQDDFLKSQGKAFLDMQIK